MAHFIGGVFATDAGMVCLWDPKAFGPVVDYDTWEGELCEDADIRKHIKAGHLAPINTDRGLDGAFDVIVRVGENKQPAKLTEREAKYILAESQPYLFKCTGRICVSGIEHVECHPGRSVGCLPVREGQYVVKVYFLAWDDEPGMQDKKGRPKPGALGDFVVLVNPKARGRVVFRTKIYALEPHKP